MQVVLNGKDVLIEGEATLTEFLLQQELSPETIIVEYNGEIVKKDKWKDVVLQDHDRLEVLKFVGGG